VAITGAHSSELLEQELSGSISDGLLYRENSIEQTEISSIKYSTY
jgi:hypothetical protein